MSRLLSLLAAALCAAVLLLADLECSLAARPSPAEQKIEAALESPTQLEFIETPLSEVVDFLKNYHAIEIQINTKALDEVGVGTDTPITKDLKGLSLRSVLNLMLADLDLTYVVQDDVLLITTREDAASRLSTVLYYPVADSKTLIEVITTTIEPQSWQGKGGPGAITGTTVNGVETLAVLQSYHVHRKISQLLADLPKAPQGKPQDIGSTPAEQRIEEVLAGPTELEFVETPLYDVVDYLKQRHGIEIQLDTKALEEVGISADTPVSKVLKHIPLRSALKLILRDLDLTYVIDGEVLLITTPEEDDQLCTKIYPVSDLLAGGSKGASFPSNGEVLIDLIMSSVATTTWDDAGGPGSISGASFGNVDMLLISQSQEVHEEIATLLEKLRSVAGVRPPAVDIPLAQPAGRSAAGPSSEPAPQPQAKAAAEAAKSPPAEKAPATEADNPFAAPADNPSAQPKHDPFD